MQWLYVNGRAIKSRTLTAAIDQAYRSLTPDRRYPVVVLMVDLSPAELDINVSPTKSEVKFHREGGVFDAVRRGIKDALLAHGMIPSMEQIAAVNEALGLLTQPAMDFPAATSYAVTPQPNHPFTPSQPSGESYNPVGQNAAQNELLDGLRILGQVDQTFIIAENRTSMLVIDQHVAHERILYEMLVNTRGSTAVERQQLISPESISVPRHVAQMVAEKLSEFAAVGYDIEPFGQDTLLVRSVPALGRGKGALQVLHDLLDEIAEGASQGGWTPSRDDVYIMCSCKMAIKAGDPLGHAEMQKLIEDLAQTENPYLCPHGRPITIVWPKSDIRRRFKR